MRHKICIFISGGGSNLAAIIHAIDNGELSYVDIVTVIADRDCVGKVHASNADVPFILVDRKLDRDTFNQTLLSIVPDCDLIVLAGFLSIIPPVLIEKYPNKIINLHPSLLPKFGGVGMYGMNVHRAVIAAGETESGCSVHYVDNGIDTGEIIAQAHVTVSNDDTPETLQKRVSVQEHALLVKTLVQLLN